MRCNKLIFVLLSLLLLSGCEQLQQMAIENTCDVNSAYTTGVNDGKNGKDMQAHYASICPSNKNQYNAAYQRGYRFGLSHRDKHIVLDVNKNKSSSWKCVQSSSGQKICGYGCHKTGGAVVCADGFKVY